MEKKALEMRQVYKSYKKIEPRYRKTDGFMALVAAISIEDVLPVETTSNDMLDAITF